MPLFKVEEKGAEKPRLVEAPSRSAAIMHAAKGRYSATTIKNAGETAKLMAGGVTLETAGEQVEAADGDKAEG